MKKLLLILLLSAVGFSTINAITDVYSGYATLLQAANPNDREMRAALALWYDVLPEYTKQQKDRKAQLSSLFAKKFHMNIDQADITIPKLLKLSGICQLEQGRLADSIKDLQYEQSKLSENLQKNREQLEEAREERGKLQFALNNYSAAYKELTEALSEAISINAGLTSLGKADVNTLINNLSDAYNEYKSSLDALNKAGRQLGFNVVLDDEYLNTIVEGQLSMFTASEKKQAGSAETSSVTQKTATATPSEEQT